MTRQHDRFLESLVADLKPVAPLTQSRGMVLAAVATIASIVATGLTFRFRPDLISGRLDPVYLLSSGVFFVLACAAAWTVVQMSRPQVGNNHAGWLWAGAMALLLPVIAVITVVTDQSGSHAAAFGRDGWECLGKGSLMGTFTFGALILWLRRGAPVFPERAGLLAGIAAGSSGIFAFALHCGHDDIVHIGLWHALVIAVCAGIGRAVIPRLIRW